MSATYELRAELTKRGIEWRWEDERTTYWYVTVDGEEWGEWTAIEMGGYLHLSFSSGDVLTPAQAVEATLGPTVTGETSDGYHTFNELYHHRAVLFSVIVRDHPELAWKSRLHHDGTMYDGMFIVGIDTPSGQATYHYDIEPYWDMFDCKELDRAPEWDGHTPDEAIARIATLGDSDATAARQGDAGTCRFKTVIDKDPSRRHRGNICECDGCGYRCARGFIEDERFKHCPNCGRRIEGVDE